MKSLSSQTIGKGLFLLMVVFLFSSCTPVENTIREEQMPTATAVAEPVRTPDEVISGVMEFYLSPTCGCCGVHLEAMRAYSEATEMTLEVIERDSAELSAYKKAAGVPPSLWSCHTTYAEGYFLEGHVPISAVEWLLTEKPEGVKGIATRHGDGETNPETWLGEAYYVIYEDGRVEGPLAAETVSVRP